METNENIFWNNRRASGALLSPEGELRARTNKAIAVTATILGLTIVISIVLIVRVFTPPRIIVETGTGWPISGPASPWKESRVAMGTVFNEMMLNLLNRTDKGFVPELSEFADRGFLASMGAMRPRSAGNGGYTQGFTFTEIRPVGIGVNTAIIRVRGMLSVTTQTQHSFNDIFIEFTFRRRKQTVNNVLGWCVVDARELSNQEFFSSERKAIQDRKFEPSNMPSMIDKGAGAETTPKPVNGGVSPSK